MDNQKLSEYRAEAIARLLKKNLDDPKVDVRWDGAGSRETRVKCIKEKYTTNYELSQCNKPNRRVEVRVSYTR